MGTKFEEASQSGLIEKINAWLYGKYVVRVSDLQREFSISFPLAHDIVNHFVKEGVLAKPDGFFYRVLIYNPFHAMKIYLLDMNLTMVEAFVKEFGMEENIEIVHDDFAHFLNAHPDVDCIVSPANSFGYMDGGYDKAITDYFGNELQQHVQKEIKDRYFGEQPVGSALVVDIPSSDKKLIHVPTMRIPSPIRDPFLIYQCMRVTLMEALKAKVHAIVIPAFGGATGNVEPRVIAKYMKAGYRQVREFVLENGIKED